MLVAPGRLVWEKGQHDAIRALALLHRGIVTLPDGTTSRPRLKIVGVGPEEARLRAHAQELGVGDAVTFGSVPYDDMPGLFAGASALLLGSQSSALGGRHPFDVPRAFWEEQFGFVFVEAMAAGLDIVATTNGAIPEVLQGQGTLVPAGDYIGMARALAPARSRGDRAPRRLPAGVVAALLGRRVRRPARGCLRPRARGLSRVALDDAEHHQRLEQPAGGAAPGHEVRLGPDTTQAAEDAVPRPRPP